MSQRDRLFLFQPCFELGEYLHEHRAIPSAAGILGIFAYLEYCINLSTGSSRIAGTEQLIHREHPISGNLQPEESGSDTFAMCSE